ncbi:RhuM family protein [Flavobacterium aurantiibacter]|uniref:DNA-binding protein n=1 Tax=Flavobacterium aurantiibacter TaxID=2023067 RepID=A0A255ZLZ1_9FLAO|nr:RhuM family protein [Flavobacterium aurantiibacter]OYQ42528.1 DNA-binding protein [Flavobacterium aurantiibacter]
MKNEIVLYQSGELAEYIEVRLDEDTVWLNRNQIATLFGRDIKTIGKHINNVFSEGELDKTMVVAKFATTTKHGAIDGKTQTTLTEHYNLDVIISVGYRVKSKQGTQFRIWATNVLRDYLLKGYALNQRMDRIENNYEKLNKEVKQISLQLKTPELPNQGIFFDGQIFDAYTFTSALIKKAKTEIILIDNYIDESTLTHLSKKAENIKALLLTKSITKQLQLDVRKANEQFAHFEVKELKTSHDRFLIIDQKELYHLGASLKDLGKKWFAFSKLDGTILGMMLEQIKKEVAI